MRGIIPLMKSNIAKVIIFVMVLFVICHITFIYKPIHYYEYRYVDDDYEAIFLEFGTEVDASTSMDKGKKGLQMQSLIWHTNKFYNRYFFQLLVIAIMVCFNHFKKLASFTRKIKEIIIMYFHYSRYKDAIFFAQ